MTDDRTYLRGAGYVLGEHETDYASIANLAELAARYRLAPNARLWGWGGIRTTGRDVADLAVAAGVASLRAAALEPAAIDALVLCANDVPGPAEAHGHLVERILRGTGLGDIPFYGQFLNRCANLLAGLDLARALVRSGRYHRILLVTADKAAPGADRMSQFALYSDGAAGCVVSADAGGDDLPSYELLDCATAQHAATLDWTNQISSDLARAVNERLLAPHGLKLGDIAALLHANLFTPLVTMKERQAGFAPEQLYLDNIPRIGHCFAADPLINLVDRAAQGGIDVGHCCLLAVSVPGSRIGALLQRIR